MNGLNEFLNKLNEETDNVGQEDVSRNLAKEEALRLIADFVKTVKTKFSKQADRLEILNAAERTLGFYVDEIESDSFSASLSLGMDSVETTPIPAETDEVDSEDL